MKTQVIFVLLLLASLVSTAQKDNKYDKAYVCTKGKVHFFASTPFEDVEATSTTAVCVLNTETQKVSAKVQMASFVFPKALMQEHFNENYIESDRYPFAVLDGVITDNIDFTKDGTYNVNIKATFEVHGVKKARDIKGVVVIKNGQPYSATASFDVALVDHNIKIPTAVIAKIAEVVKVDVTFMFEKYLKS